MAKLKLVPFNPNDYSLSAVLTNENGTISTDERVISAALSLYFQWEDHRSSYIYPKIESVINGHKCEILYDNDERFPTELYLKFSETTNLLEYEMFSEILVRFEVFRTCFEFHSSVISLPDIKTGRHVVISLPEEIIVYKTRKLPRIFITQNESKDMPNIIWECSDTKSGNKLNILELGMKSMAATSEFPINSRFGIIKIGNLNINAEFLRTVENKNIFIFIFKDGVESGKFFDFYKSYAYPTLKSRYDYPLELGIKLYEETGYFGKYLTIEENYKKEIHETWNNIKSGTHISTADYFVVNESNVPNGSSSSTLAFYKNETPVWFFHQLCSITNPSLIASSGFLYMWRAEYLAARPEELLTGVCFNGKSRWLERLYVKFSQQLNSSDIIYPVKYKKINCKKSNNNSKNINIDNYKIGEIDRFCTKKNDYMASVQPKYLNASGSLNALISVWGGTSKELISNTCNSLIDKTNCSDMNIVLITEESFDLSYEEGEDVENSRFCIFKKESLVDLINSIEHSIAVTERKLNNV